MLVQHILPSAEHAAAVPALDADDGADSTFGTDDDVPVMMIPPGEASDFGSEPDVGPVAAPPVRDTRCLTHKPARSKDCADCTRGKTRSRRKLKGAFARSAIAFGDLVTMDHIHTRGNFGRAGLGGGVC